MRPRASLTVALVALVALVAALVMAPPRAEARMQATLEFGPGVSIPLTNYIDVSGKDGHNTIENSVHASLNLSLLFGNWTFRYAVNWIKLGRQDLKIPGDIFQEYEAVQTFLAGSGLAGTFSLPNLPNASSAGDLDDTMAFHSISFGYRFYLLRGTWQPYIPLELGATIVSSDQLSRTIYGATASTGIGLDVNVWGPLYVGLAARYNFYITETDQALAVLGLVTSRNIYDSSVAMAHIISITTHLQARY